MAIFITWYHHFSRTFLQIVFFVSMNRFSNTLWNLTNKQQSVYQMPVDLSENHIMMMIWVCHSEVKNGHSWCMDTKTTGGGDIEYSLIDNIFLCIFMKSFTELFTIQHKLHRTKPYICPNGWNLQIMQENPLKVSPVSLFFSENLLCAQEKCDSV